MRWERVGDKFWMRIEERTRYHIYEGDISYEDARRLMVSCLGSYSSNCVHKLERITSSRSNKVGTSWRSYF